ncbi:alpha/beta hydrolase family protein [Methylobacterium sp. JK268]
MSTVSEKYWEDSVILLSYDSGNFMFFHEATRIYLKSNNESRLIYELKSTESALYFDSRSNILYIQCASDTERGNLVALKFSLAGENPVKRVEMAFDLETECDLFPACVQGVDGIVATLNKTAVTSYFIVGTSIMEEIFDLQGGYVSLYYFKGSKAVVIIKTDETPYQDQYFIVDLDTGAHILLPGKPVDFNGGFILLIREDAEMTNLSMYDIDKETIVTDFDRSFNYVDARFITRKLVIASTHLRAQQNIIVLDPYDGRHLKSLSGSGVVKFFGGSNNGILIKRIHLAQGSRWLCVADREVHEVPGGVQPWPHILEYSLALDSGACCLAFIPSEGCTNGAVIALHGGPESCEWNDIRYGGLYREFVAAGKGVFVLNYRGSSNFGFRIRQLVHHKWRQSFLEDLENLVSYVCDNFKIEESDISLFGVSFGATLALVAGAARHDFRTIVAVAPVVNLAEHVEYAEENTGYSGLYRRWFESRFGDEIQYINEFTLLSNVRTHIIFGMKDRIIRPFALCRLYRNAKVAGLPWRIYAERNTGHTPMNAFETINRFDRIREIIA